jgi:hypothetical protein
MAEQEKRDYVREFNRLVIEADQIGYCPRPLVVQRFADDATAQRAINVLERQIKAHKQERARR